MKRVSAEWRSLFRISGTILLSSFFAIGFIGCGEDDKGTTQSNLTPEERLRLSWDLFEDGSFSEALDGFNGVIASNGSLSDAWNGKGWSLGKLTGRLPEASAAFAEAFRIDTTRYDALGGAAFVAFQSNNWDGAISKSDSLLYRRPGWRFLHDQNLNEADIHIVRAASFYNLANYSASFAVVVTELNPVFEADVNTPEGIRELSQEIERLRRIHG